MSKKHIDTTQWTPEKLGAEYQKQQDRLKILEHRISNMTVQGNSPETRLSNFIAAHKNQAALINKLVNDLAGFKTSALKHFGWMTVHMKWKEDDINQNIEEGSQGGYSEELTEALEFLEELKGN